MLKKIPPKPKDGTLRVHKKFTFRKIATKDEYYARFRFVYHVQRYNDLENMAQVGPYSSDWRPVATFAIKDNAEIFVNMLALQQENAKQALVNNNTADTYSTGSILSSALSYVQNMGVTNTIAK
mgnify:CR=1 FL=1